MIEIRNVTMAYDRAPVVKDVSFDLPDCGITALIGPNGGKVNATFRWRFRSSGEVVVDGKVSRTGSRTNSQRRWHLAAENHPSVRLTVAEPSCLAGIRNYGRGTKQDEEMVVKPCARCP